MHSIRIRGGPMIVVMALCLIFFGVAASAHPMDIQSVVIVQNYNLASELLYVAPADGTVQSTELVIIDTCGGDYVVLAFASDAVGVLTESRDNYVVNVAENTANLNVTYPWSGNAVVSTSDAVGLHVSATADHNAYCAAVVAEKKAIWNSVTLVTPARGALRPGDTFNQVIIWRKSSNGAKDVQTGVLAGGRQAA